jgi:tetratricopeptide (TPR) repeat protein
VSDALYERYKDALRRGHVAAFRGRLDAAVVAYGEAADIAPERSLPHTSLGAVLVRLGNREEAVAAYGRALERAPDDEAALAGRAALLATMGHPADAAQDLDRLAERQDAAGRVADACDSARRALELAESKPRRRLVEELASRLRSEPGDEAATRALEAARGVLEPAVADEAKPAADGGPEAGRTTDVSELDTIQAEPTPQAADGARLTIEAEQFIDAGDSVAAHGRLLEAARAHRAAGRINAALDACYLALGLNPFDFELHVLLTELYLEHGWRAPAAEKLLLLGRVVELDGDDPGRDRICAIATEQFPEDERLAAMCA